MSTSPPQPPPESLRREFLALLVLYAVLTALPLLALWLDG